MRFALKLSLALGLVVAGTSYVTASIIRTQDQPDAGGFGMDAEMMKKAMELAAPGEQHAKLMKLAGSWEQQLKFRMGPDAPWIEATGTAQSKAILGGRYLQEDVSFDMMGMPVQGLSMLGFDNLKKEYISFWADSMGTWWVTARGKETKEGTVEFKGTMVDLAGERPYRMVVHHREDGSIFTEMFDTIPPAGDVKVMEITSKRKK